ncbi:type II toxin-antitoxin system prevent-host-death family antitoxin [Streptomyces sp. NPDC007984]|uniref:type II toxin-antitoxin system Phd/YefM family antitoxin n=1 Tax=Streptomyces sp. NPDC007984 TaxID=3364801 RepID=UPI0036E55713
MEDLPRVGAREFRKDLRAFLAAVEQTGQSLVVTRRGRPVAILLPPADDPAHEKEN